MRPETSGNAAGTAATSLLINLRLLTQALACLTRRPPDAGGPSSAYHSRNFPRWREVSPRSEIVLLPEAVRPEMVDAFDQTVAFGFCQWDKDKLAAQVQRHTNKLSEKQSTDEI